jgi:hypothetical protein
MGLNFVAAATVVVVAYWNVGIVYWTSENLPARETEEIVIQEKRLAPVRANLQSIDYRGEIAFITNSALSGLPPSKEDDKRWGQSQYVLIPWLLVRDKRDSPFVLADFWDGPPVVPLQGLTKVYDNGSGLILFRRNLAR